MQNILNEGPLENLRSRCKYITTFVDIKDISNKRVLDVGCGFGWFEQFALDNKIKKIVGIDISEENIESVRKYFLGNDKISFDKCSVLEMPYKKDTFDTITAWEVLEHIPKNNENRMFKSVHNILKRGGIFYLSTPLSSFWFNIFDPAFWLIGHRHYHLEDIYKLASDSGFKVIRSTKKGGFWTIIWILNLYISKWIFRRRPFFEQYFIEKLVNEMEEKDGVVNLFIKMEKL